MISTPNYPDILGYITDGQKMSFGVVQAAMAIRPQIVRAGRPFEVILLLQNTSDVNVTIKTHLHVPKQDADNQPRRFITRSEEVTTKLRPAEVGYLALPVAPMPDAAISDAYKIGASLDVKPHGRPRKVRVDREDVNLDYYFFLQDTTITRVMELKSLLFNTQKRGLLGSSMEANFGLIASRSAQMSDLKPVWFSLWALGDSTDVRPLLERYQQVLEKTILPQLNREVLIKPLFKATRERFESAGYELKPIEVHYIVKLMVAVLEMASKPGDEPYNVMSLLAKGWSDDGSPIPLPNWCRMLLHDIGRNERMLDHPVTALTTSLFDELLRDAIIYGFKLMQYNLGDELGSEYDMVAYANQLIQMLEQHETPLTFVDIYLPLITGGIMVDEQVLLKGEQSLEMLHNISDVFYDHYAKCSTCDPYVLNMIDRSISHGLRKYGYQA